MSNNSSECPPQADWITMGTDGAKYFTYDILVYPYFFMGVTGHTLFSTMCYKRAKTDKGFLLQAFLSTVRVLEIISFTLLTFCVVHCAGLVRRGVPWFQQCFCCMWFAAHISIPMVNGFINTSLLLTLCIAVDRLIAISKPHIYRQDKWQRKRNRVGAFSFCLFVGFAIVVADAGRFVLVVENGLYTMKDNFDYLNNSASTVFISVRIVVLVSGVSALWVCNALIIRVHGLKMVQIGTNVANTTKTATELIREAKRKEAERALFLLIVCQGTINAVAIGSLASWYMTFYLAPMWLHCTGVLMLWAPLDDAGLQIAAVLDFYFPLMISKPVQRMVFPRWSKGETAAAQTTSTVTVRSTAVAK